MKNTLSLPATVYKRDFLGENGSDLFHFLFPSCLFRGFLFSVEKEIGFFAADVWVRRARLDEHAIVGKRRREECQTVEISNDTWKGQKIPDSSLFISRAVRLDLCLPLYSPPPFCRMTSRSPGEDDGD